MLWPDVHVGESSLAWCVSQARKALGQKRGDREPIETVHGRGYRFGAEVRAAGAPARRAPGSLFVGRQHAMASLRGALDRVRLEGKGSGLLVLGEAGIGKTRCAEELAAQARADGVSVWAGRCLNAEGTPAFWPWIQILRESLRQRAGGPAAVQAEALLGDLVPRDSATLEPELMNGRSGGFWVLDRLVTFLLESAAATPGLLVVDDVQWADHQSLRVLELLAPDLEKHPIVLLATLRDTDEPSAPSGRRSLERLGRHLASVPLSGLGEAEVEEYLAAATGRPPSAQVVAEVHRKSGGNPLFVQELAQRLIDHGADGAGGLGELGGARSLIVARLERRDPEILGVLEAASVVGETFDLPVLAAMLQVAPGSLVPVLDLASDARLVERRPSAGGYAFVHALVRAAVQEGLSGAERCEWHRLAGEALEARAVDDERLTQLAFHFYQALPAGTHAKAARYSVAAANAEARVFAHEEALAHWTRALEALDFHPGSDPETRGRVLVGLATTELQLGRRADSREHLKQAIALAGQRRDPAQLVAAARVLRHSLLSHLGMDRRAREALESALPMLTDDRERATALSLLGAAGSGGASSARALQLARPLGGQTLLEALWSRAFSLTGPDDVRELLGVSGEMLALDASLGRSWWSGEAHYAAFCAHAHRGDAAAMDRALDEVQRLARYCRLPEALWNHDRLGAQLSMQRGALDDAERAWKELSERQGFADVPYVKLLSLMHRRALAVERGAPTPAMHDLWQLVSQWSPGPRTQTLLMTSLLDAGRREEARWHFEELAASGFAALPRDRLLLACLCALAVVAIALDDRPRAAELESALAPYASFNTPDLLTTTLGSVAHYLALLAQHRGDAPLATERFELALARNREMGLRPRLARTERAYAGFLAGEPLDIQNLLRSGS